MNALLLRALLALLALPGIVACLNPLSLVGATDGGWAGSVVGVVPLAAGTIILIGCVREFYVAVVGSQSRRSGPWPVNAPR